LFQPLADGLKFLFKEEVMPGHVNKFYYVLAPIITLIPAMTTMVVLPFGQMIDPESGQRIPLILANIDIGILFIFAVGSLGVYGVVIGGWASNNKYSFLGSVRSSAQMISYELAMGISVIPVLLLANPPGMEGGLSLVNVITSQDSLWNFVLMPISALLFLICLFAETNRTPFDMAESETDLVGGFHTEYGSFKFGLFFVSEYTHIIVGSGVFVALFFGGSNFLPWLPNPWPSGIIGGVISVLWFIAKVVCMIFLFIWVRWTLPRFRYDQVMNLGWKILLPISIANLVFYIIAFAVYEKLIN
jgi:NADH-quinone oxidoreductase subunit H